MDSLKPKILVVEDLKLAQKIALMVLSGFNCEVEIANSGEEALELCQTKQYHLIFMDMGLPGIDGVTTIEAIRKKEGDTLSPTIIVALTAHNSPVYRERCATVGINDYLLKPLTTENSKALLEKFNLLSTSAPAQTSSAQAQHIPTSGE